jgi:hypothetical protein
MSQYGKSKTLRGLETHMKIQGGHSALVWLIVVLLLGGLSTAAGAATLALVPSKTSAERGETFQLDIVLDDPTGVAGCAFTLTYPADRLIAPDPDLAGEVAGITSTFFQNFYQTRMHRENASNTGKIIFSGANINASTGGAPWTAANMILFSIPFTVQSDALLGEFDFTLEQSQLLHTDAGWGDGTNPEAAAVLVGAVPNDHENWDDLSKAFPVLLGDQTNPFTPVTHMVTPGIQPCADTDQDGLCDTVETNTGAYVSPQDTGTDPHNPDSDGDEIPDGWEVTYGLDPLHDNDASVDLDGDGFSNLEEYERGTDPGDPGSHPPRAMPWLPLLLDD